MIGLGKKDEDGRQVRIEHRGIGCIMPAAICERANLAKGDDKHCQLGIVASNVFIEFNLFAEFPIMRDGSYSLE